MYHSITFGDGTLDDGGHFIGINTWEDWHLIPANRPDIAMPGMKTKFVELPGLDGSIDLSDYLRGGPSYSSRSGSIEFYVDNDHEDWITIKEKILKSINGKKIKMCLEDDPMYYYIGRITFNEWKSDPGNSMVTLRYILEPYKYTIFTAGEDPLLWDPFNFETDYDWYTPLYKVRPRGETFEIPIPNMVGRITVTITMVESGTIQAEFGDESVVLSRAGETASFEVNVVKETSLIVSGDGVANFTLKGASL